LHYRSVEQVVFESRRLSAVCRKWTVAASARGQTWRGLCNFAGGKPGQESLLSHVRRPCCRC